MDSNISDVELLKKIKKDDRKAFAMLLDRHSDFAYTIAFRIIQNSEDAEEVVQDQFLKIARNPDKFKGESKFSTWFYRVVSNASLSRLRKKKYATEQFSEKHDELIIADTPLQDLTRSDQQNIIHLLLSGLNPEERKLITLYYLKEFTQDEMTELTGLDKNTIKVKLFRARKKLSEQLNKLGGVKEMLI